METENQEKKQGRGNAGEKQQTGKKKWRQAQRGRQGTANSEDRMDLVPRIQRLHWRSSFKEVRKEADRKENGGRVRPQPAPAPSLLADGKPVT